MYTINLYFCCQIPFVDALLSCHANTSSTRPSTSGGGARTKERLREQDLDAIVVADPANMNYLTGYDGWSFYVHQAVVVTPDRDEPIWIGRDMDGDGARATTHLSDDSIRAYSDDHVHSPHDLHPMDYVAGVLDELDVADGRIGLEMDAAYFTAKSYTRLQGNLPDAEFEDATLLVGWIRVKKSDQELEYMREAARISENAMRAGLDVIEEGVPEYEVAAEIYEQLIEGTDEYGGDYPAIVPLMPSGDHTGTPHLTWTDRPFEEGDPVIIELRLPASLPLAAGPDDPSSATRRPSFRRPQTSSSRAGGGARRRRSPASPARPSRRRGGPPSRSTGWKRRTASGTRWGSAIRRTGASTPRASVRATTPSSKRT